MKVLFIDDEPIIRKGLQAIIPWKEFGYTEFYEAEDGTEGLSCIHKLQPELVILDIKMQDITGIEMSHMARANGFRGRIIILSGYSDFEYAKSAIAADVTAYLLKPVDTEELVSAVRKVNDELEREKLLSVYSTQPMQLSRNSILLDILNGKMAYTQEIFDTYHIDLFFDYFRLASLALADSAQDLRPITAFVKSRKSVDMISISNCESCLLFKNKKSFHLFLDLLQSQEKKNHSDGESIFPALILLSSAATSYHDIPVLYEQTLQLQAQQFYYKTESCILDYEQFQNLKPIKFNQLEFMQSVLNSILLNDSHKLHELFEQFYLSLRLGKTPKELICFIFTNTYSYLYQELGERYPKVSLTLPSVEHFREQLYHHNYLYEWILTLEKTAIAAMNDLTCDNDVDIIKKLCQYIESNYAKPLRLDDLAEQFGYNSSYLGKLFYKNTQEHFCSYVNRTRVSHAKELLKKGESVAHACEQTGFSNVDYFTRQFKKFAGTIPSLYRP